MNQDDVNMIEKLLLTILENDNEPRKAAEAQLATARAANPSTYFCYLMHIIVNSQQVASKSLAAVIFRRSILEKDPNDKTKIVWDHLSGEAKEWLKQQALVALGNTSEKSLVHKVCNAVVEIAACLNSQDSVVWQELLNTLFQMVHSSSVIHIEAALQVFNGLFEHMIDHFSVHSKELLQIFQTSLQVDNLDVNLAALQAASNFIQTADSKNNRAFLDLIPLMVTIPLKAMKADEETIVEDAMIEFNGMAEIEPNFFKKCFKDLAAQFWPLAQKTDWTKSQIRNQPVEFMVSIIERIPSLVKKDEEFFKSLLDLIFKIMIDIDEDIDDSWLTPPEGYRLQDEDEEQDAVNFGKDCIDRIVGSVGEGKTLPLLGILVQNVIANDGDWRYKNAGLMALSQIGEYIDEIEKIKPMMPIIIKHLVHPNPKIRFAALHCIGQISDDMDETFQEAYYKEIIPALIQSLQDPVQRVVAHACAAVTNFIEELDAEMLAPYVVNLVERLEAAIQYGCSHTKENGITAYATVAESMKEQYIPYFDRFLQFIQPYITGYNEPVYKQFKGQLIEALTIVCASVGVDAFRPHIPVVVKIMLDIQNKGTDEKDPMRTYMFGAWQRLVLLLKSEFAPYLPEVIPALFRTATLNPEMSIQGGKEGQLTDILNELKPTGEVNKDINVNTSETEEKDVAIQMLMVFIDELEAAYAPYVEQTSKILLSLVDYEVNSSIRSSVASAFPGLILSVKKAYPENKEYLCNMGRTFLGSLWEAIKTENDTDTLTSQIQAIKMIIDEIEIPFMEQAVINQMANQMFEILKKSEDGVIQCHEFAKNNKVEEEHDEEEEDEDEAEMIKEEIKTEQQLQLSLGEFFGTLFKTHKSMSQQLVTDLFGLLPKYITSEEKHKQKFGLYILDDMVEFLGPEVLGQHFVEIGQQIIRFGNSEHESLRQAATYGIGQLAKHSGSHFAQLKTQALEVLNYAINIPLPAKYQGKSTKTRQFNNARENGISALGFIMRHQSTSEEQDVMIPTWLNYLPIIEDQEEARNQNEILTDILETQPQKLFGADMSRFEQVVMIIGDIFREKYLNKTTMTKLAKCIKQLANDPNLQGPFKTIYDTKLAEKARTRLNNAMKFTE